MGRAPRSDARRNRDRVLAAAREAFAEEGPGASLNEIARRAGVGPGTLYRHFPARRDLHAAVLAERVEGLCALADELAASRPAGEALDAWLRAFLDHARTDHGLGGAMMTEPGDGEPDLGFDCHAAIQGAAERVLARARDEGAARADLAADDVVQLVAGIALSTVRTGPERAERLLDLVTDALRARPGG